jgi:hypothetical protein
VNDGKAQTILNAIVSFMDRMGIEFSKVVGLGSDGAAVMLGRGTGHKIKAYKSQHSKHTLCCSSLGIGGVPCRKKYVYPSLIFKEQ